MYIFGLDVPILELLVVFCIVVVVYLVILEFEFRQLRKITKRFDEEEIALGRAMRELRDEIGSLRGVIQSTPASKQKKA
jgi:type II secretory pathway component PulM